MTYIEGQGSMFDAPVQALVNTVNCVGVMGGGLAKIFATKFPLMELDYISYCQEGLLTPGIMHSYYSNIGSQQWIINFPTKDDWRNPSQLEYVEVGMQDLVSFVARHGIESIAIPALGCGLGGLDWDDVKPVILKYIKFLTYVDWFVYDPK